VHLSSSLLVVPQFAVATFTLVYLVGERGWDSAAAGRLIFAFQLLGAAGRIATGIWSDRVGSRLRPMRQLAMASAVLMAALAIGAATHSVLIIAVFGLAAVVTVADNGLGYTSVAELAGVEWSGRALGVQNTAQNLTAVITAPVLAAIIGDSRYALAFAVVTALPVVAIATTPVRAEQRHDAAGAASRDQDAAPTGAAGGPN
jgi:MFS family permease